MNNKVALMTWYQYQNYGTVLQASALYAAVSNLGYTTTIINYMPKGDVVELKKYPVTFLTKKIISGIYNQFNQNITYESAQKDVLFANYIQAHMDESEVCTCYSELFDLKTKYDAFVCGSDQIWSPLCYDDKYFLSFVDDPQRMIAYAPSIGSLEVKNEYIRRKMVEYIYRFQHLSIREIQGQELIKKLTGQDAKVVLDPTLLLTPKEWNSMIVSQADLGKLGKDYIICYFLGASKKYMRYVRTFSRKTNKRIYLIPVTVAQKKSKYAVPFEVGPSEFVLLISNASYLFTDSFHGMAFACNYNIPFTVFKRFKESDPRNQNSRVISLLKLLNIEERLVDYNATVECMECDFTEANARLQKQRTESLKYLKEALLEAVGASTKKGENTEYKITDICCGCGACAAVCPKKAIVIKKDKDGFEHYFIDQNVCIKCEKCKAVCPFINIQAPMIGKSQKLYAMKSKCKEDLIKSSSGGVAHEISKRMIGKGYWICGCMYESDTDSARHIMISPKQKSQLFLLQGSKYIQSISWDAMLKIECMEDSQQLVFVGTPCQTAAVDKLLQRKGKRANMLLVDLICHGVPSYFLWEKYMRDRIEKNQIGEHPLVYFRSSEGGWRKRRIAIEKDNRYFMDENKDDFYAFFRRGLCHMESCFECPYREKSAADIRIGDYWGPRFEQDKEGVSMVIAMTKKGDVIIQELIASDSCRAEEYGISEYWSVQYPTNSNMPVFREKLLDDLRNNSKQLSTLRKEYCQYYDMREKVLEAKKELEKLVYRK